MLTNLCILKWCCFLTVVTLFGSTSAGSLRKTSDAPTKMTRYDSILPLLLKQKDLLRNELKEFSSWIHYVLHFVRTIVRAARKVMSEEFGIGMNQVQDSRTGNLLKNFQNFLTQIEDYSEVIEVITPSNPRDRSGKFPEKYILKNAYATLKEYVSMFRGFLTEFVTSYNYYLSEVTLTRCLGKYVSYAYPNWYSAVEYPFHFSEYLHEWIADIARTFKIDLKHFGSEHRNEIWKRYKRSAVSNQIVQISPQPIFRYPGTSAESSQLNQLVSQVFNFDNALSEVLGWQQGEQNDELTIPTRCIQNYALETLWKYLESYLLN